MQEQNLKLSSFSFKSSYGTNLNCCRGEKMKEWNWLIDWWRPFFFFSLSFSVNFFLYLTLSDLVQEGLAQVGWLHVADVVDTHVKLKALTRGTAGHYKSWRLC